MWYDEGGLSSKGRIKSSPPVEPAIWRLPEMVQWMH